MSDFDIPKTIHPDRRKALETKLNGVVYAQPLDEGMAFGASLEVAKQTANALLKMDPTPAKDYTFYLCNLYLQLDFESQGRLINEDGDKATAYLWAASRLNHTHPTRLNRRVNGKKQPISLPELYEQVRPHLTKLQSLRIPDVVADILGDEISGGKQAEANRIVINTSDEEEQALLRGDNPAAIILANNQHYKLVRLNTLEAARFYGRGTKWCTAMKGTDAHFHTYNNSGNLHVLMMKGKASRFQLHYNPWNFNNEADAVISFETILEELNGYSAAKAELADLIVQVGLAQGREREFTPVFRIGKHSLGKHSEEYLDLFAQAQARDEGKSLEEKADREYLRHGEYYCRTLLIALPQLEEATLSKSIDILNGYLSRDYPVPVANVAEAYDFTGPAVFNDFWFDRIVESLNERPTDENNRFAHRSRHRNLCKAIFAHADRLTADYPLQMAEIAKRSFSNSDTEVIGDTAQAYDFSGTLDFNQLWLDCLAKGQSHGDYMSSWSIAKGLANLLFEDKGESYRRIAKVHVQCTPEMQQQAFDILDAIADCGDAAGEIEFSQNGICDEILKNAVNLSDELQIRCLQLAKKLATSSSHKIRESIVTDYLDRVVSPWTTDKEGHPDSCIPNPAHQQAAFELLEELSEDGTESVRRFAAHRLMSSYSSVPAHLQQRVLERAKQVANSNDYVTKPHLPEVAKAMSLDNPQAQEDFFALMWSAAAVKADFSDDRTRIMFAGMGSYTPENRMKMYDVVERVFDSAGDKNIHVAIDTLDFMCQTLNGCTEKEQQRALLLAQKFVMEKYDKEKRPKNVMNRVARLGLYMPTMNSGNQQQCLKLIEAAAARSNQETAENALYALSVVAPHLDPELQIDCEGTMRHIGINGKVPGQDADKPLETAQIPHIKAHCRFAIPCISTLLPSVQKKITQDAFDSPQTTESYGEEAASETRLLIAYALSSAPAMAPAAQRMFADAAESLVNDKRFSGKDIDDEPIWYIATRGVERWKGTSLELAADKLLAPLTPEVRESRPRKVVYGMGFGMGMY